MRICAWCQDEMPSRSADSALITHGICEACLIKMHEETRAFLEHLQSDPQTLAT
jgi:hypothetical protein